MYKYNSALGQIESSVPLQVGDRVFIIEGAEDHFVEEIVHGVSRAEKHTETKGWETVLIERYTTVFFKRSQE